jgi:uncharacterized membrane protein YphA (DoxX/SURF4 family)
VEIVALIARLALAGTFVVSAVAKLRDHGGARQAVADFGMPTALVGPTAALLAPLELASAALLLTTGWGVTAGALLALGMLSAFTVGITVNLTRGNRVECHCFGQLSTEPLSWSSVVRNLGLMIVAGAVLAAGTAQGWPWQVVADAFDGTTTAEAWLWTAVVLLAAALVALGAVFLTMLRRYGQALLRVEALEAGGAAAHGHAHEFAPWPAPELAATLASGDDVAVSELLPDDGLSVFTFVAPHCDACGELVDELASWQSDAEGPRVVVLSPGEREAIAAKFGPVEVLAHDGSATETWRVEYTPGAVVVSSDGQIVSPPSYGAEDVRRLYRAASGRADPADLVIGPPPVREGDPLPAASVEVDGENRPLADVVGADDTVLLFWDTTCGFCSQITDDLARRQDSLSLLVVLRDDNLAGLRAEGITAPVALDRVFAVGNALQAPGTPCAVRVRDGLIASTVAVGGPEVLDLLARVRISG